MDNSKVGTRFTPSTLHLSMELTRPTPNKFKLTFRDNESQHTMVENVSATHLTTACGQTNWLRLSGLAATVLQRFLLSLATSTGELLNGDKD